MQQRSLRQFYVDAQAAARFASSSDVMIAIRVQREATQKDVAVTSSFMFPVFTKAIIEFKFFRNKSRMILLRGISRYAEYFLQRYNVRIHFAQHFDNARRPHAPVQTAALVNIVGCN